MIDKNYGIFPLIFGLALITLTDGKVCEQGHLEGNSCYEFHPDINTYAEARDICYTKKSHLADVANEKINLILQDMLEVNGVPSAYFGLQVLDGAYQWLSNRQVNQSESQMWANLNEVSGSPTVCGYITSNGQWEMGDCEAEKGFVCERGKMW